MRAAVRRIANWLRNKPVFFKIAISSFVTVAVPILILTVILIVFNDRATGDRLRSKTENNAGYATLQIQNLFDTCQLMGRNIASSETVQNALSSNAQPSVFVARAVSAVIDSVIKSGNNIHSALIYSLNGNIYTSSGVTLQSIQPGIPMDFTSTAEMMRHHWPALRRGDAPNLYQSPVGHSEYLQFIMPIFDAETAAALGLCEINISQDMILGLLAPYRYPGMHYVLYGADGVLLADSDLQELSDESIHALTSAKPTGTFSLQANGQQYIACSRHISGFEAGLLTLVSPNDTDHSLPFYLSIFAAVVLILLGFTSFALSKIITKNLVMLTRHVNRIRQGDLDDIIPVRSNDEVGQLSEDFNRMTARIKALIDQVQEVNAAKRRSDLIALQSQINPHFLYNTLESVSALIILKRDEDALLLSKALSSYYQIVLSNGVTMISVRDELRNVEYYLTIQKMRYGDKVNYTINAGEELLDYRILKLTVQPLVENAIYHGLRKKQGAGQIDICCRREKDDLLIIVRDDGIGIVETDVTRLFKPDDTEYSNRGFGLRSIDERIKLQYGHAYGLQMRSVPGEWTEFTICIPLTTMEDRDAAW